MKKTLGIIIDTALVIPPNTGVTYRLYYLSKAIVENGMNVKIFICNRNIHKIADLKKIFDNSDIEFHIIPENVFYNVKQMIDIFRSNRIDLVQFEDQNTFLFFRKLTTELKLRVCLEMHDIEATLKEFFAFNDKEIKISNKVMVKACELADLIICMTPYDYSELVKVGIDKRKLKLVPNPIDLEQFAYFGPNTKKNNLIFIGNMYYWPNQKAAKYIIEQFYPIIKQKIKNLKIYFVGMAPDGLKNKYRNHDQIKFTGPVDNLNKFLKLSTISLCPITEGSGMKVKILNYGAAGLPIIATPLGISGYEKIKSLIVLDKLGDFPDKIIELLKHKNKLIKIGKDNRKFVFKYYEINSHAKKLINIYRKCIADKPVNHKNAKVKEIPTLLWLKENRIKKNLNQNYYIVRRGKVINN